MILKKGNFFIIAVNGEDLFNIIIKCCKCKDLFSITVNAECLFSTAISGECLIFIIINYERLFSIGVLNKVYLINKAENASIHVNDSRLQGENKEE